MVAVILGGAGCGQILGVGEYHVDGASLDGGTKAAARDAGTVFQPRAPYLTGATCGACIAANCAAEREACDAT